ncbi:hypothetical protein ABS771_17375 [Methylobacterium brachiatum]|uniref:O-Antigen ligase n=1 Tax=Methylobacterium brachiatum TaxID=269660 RepID=A0ABV1R6T2_9HYPH
MSLEPIGIITFVIGFYCLLLGTRATTIAFIVICTLGSAAAILIGGANVQPAHLFLVFLALASLTWRKIANQALVAFRASEPGFWLLCLVIYGIFSSYLMPRLFAGETYIVPLGSTESLITVYGVAPLAPVSSNTTQSIYLIGDLACFVMIFAIASTSSGFMSVANAIIIYAGANIFFGILDLLTSMTGTQEALKFIRNAQYTFHDEESIGDLRRIIGSWPEASAFAGMTLSALGFTGTMWLYGRSPAITGTLAFLSLTFVILSTSSSGLVGSVVVLGILYLIALMRCGTHWNYRFSAAMVLVAPLAVLTIALLILSNEAASAKIAEYLNVLIFDKSNSESGMQRASWNAFAWDNFIDTWGLGVGLGTNRASSFVLAVLSNVGIPGAVFYILFMALCFLPKIKNTRTYFGDVRTAATVACVSLLSGAFIAGGTVDLGLLFYVLAALASAYPERAYLYSATTGARDGDRHAVVCGNFDEAQV